MRKIEKKGLYRVLLALLICVMLFAGCVPISDSSGESEMQWYSVAAQEDGSSNFYGVLDQLQTEGTAAGDFVYYLKFSTLEDAVLFLEAFEVEPSLPETLSAPGQVLLLYVTSGEGDTFSITETSTEEGSRILISRKNYSGTRNAIANNQLYILPLTPGTVISEVVAEAE